MAAVSETSPAYAAFLDQKAQLDGQNGFDPTVLLGSGTHEQQDLLSLAAAD